jgi:His-Xaa-Ser system radical SAM maturase HxsC
MRSFRAEIPGFSRRTILSVLPAAALASSWTPNRRHLVGVESLNEMRLVESLARQGLTDLHVWASSPEIAHACQLPSVQITEKLELGDVVAVDPAARRIHVLMRESDAHHTVFLTNRCNSRCVMCSQPPTKHDDEWLIEEALDVVRHVRQAPSVIGFTGGEPLLLGDQLRVILDEYRAHFPETHFDVLTNGRLFSSSRAAANILQGLDRVTWMVPLYGHADFLHDFVVQSHGAFDETLGGLLELQSYRQPIQLRIVLIRPVLEQLRELCWFITMNLPFVREVALMGCEPTGFALANKSLCELDIAEWTKELDYAVNVLATARLRPVLMNLPLCALTPNARRYAHRSISDWKQVYADECDNCAVKPDCCGLFAWHTKGWKPTKLKPILRELTA